MKKTLASEHHTHFQRAGEVAFDGLLTDEEWSALMQEIDATLCRRLKVSKLAFVKDFGSKSLDLFRDSPLLEKKLTKGDIPRIARELVDENKIRLGGDLYLTKPLTPPFCPSLQPFLVAAVFDCTTKLVTFVHPEHAFNFTGKGIAALYVAMLTRFAPALEDPFSSHFLTLGYSAGDRLSDALNPVCHG